MGGRPTKRSNPEKRHSCAGCEKAAARNTRYARRGSDRYGHRLHTRESIFSEAPSCELMASTPDSGTSVGLPLATEAGHAAAGAGDGSLGSP
eukprot:CAMPEP_0174853824 /NCGR_PEP_ID=MMETSP1114-20130205/29590_1 /TAXON_ID=312471 /ORGANISM="Neobodo designis, Strain CCAP 1951/1" /LENGTH=91 /DNA_ID=CAMNT_0016088491 /DNA_START=934 /DNA_END=1205 /DNA_ORIENTATION=-